MKKLLCIFLLLFMLNILNACNNGTPNIPSEESGSDVTNTATDTQNSSIPNITETTNLTLNETETTESVTKKINHEETSDLQTEPQNILPSILDFLKIAKSPVGETMYVWGGGWNEEDSGAGIEAVTLGVSERWAAFTNKQNSDYDYKTTRYQIHDGLDCSGFVGWAVYNVLETENGQNGYVMSSTKMAKEFSELGLGSYTPTDEVTDYKAGDIMSMPGHVWISLGECSDGSVLLLHASPPGVIFCGTSLPDGSDSHAVKLAEKIMSENYPEWYAKFPECSRPYSYLTASSQMRWRREVLSDEEGISEMTAYEIADVLFE